MGKINRIKSNLITYIWGIHINIRDSKDSQAKWCICHPELRRRGRDLGLKMGGGLVTEDEKEQMLGQQMFAGPYRNSMT